ncbi:MAG TPA: aminotransferase class V-fold PLP-dependent enzyme [Fimbriimonas sp.]|nr:aminotransferase class V-fold PLP-dependent enzyme [Fimbriimonas sp.]
MPLSRRELLTAGATLVAFRDETLDLTERALSLFGSRIEAEDEDFWAQIQQAFDLDRNIVNFNNGGCSPSPRIVQQVLKRQIEFSNQAPSDFMWRILEPEVESVRQRLAALFGCDTEEMAITRNASESLETLLLGLPMQAGDEILTTRLDYPRMHTTIDQRCRREGLKKVTVDAPVAPANRNDLLKSFEQGMTARTKMILVSQVSFMNGQIFPVGDVVKLGRKHGIPVVVDGAHAFVQYKFDNHDLGCDYYGSSLHKWLMAPIGTGFLYVRKPLIEGVWPLMAADVTRDKDIRKFEEIGTHPAANHNAIGEALTFHDMIGMERKEARLRYLRRRWTDKVVNEPKIRFFTNLDRSQSCALTTVGIAGIKTADLASWLRSKHNIFVTAIVNDFIDGIRVSPNVYTTLQEVDRFAAAMVTACREGI